MRKKNRSKSKDPPPPPPPPPAPAVARASKQAFYHYMSNLSRAYLFPKSPFPIPVTSRHVNLRPVSLVINFSSRFPHLTSPHLHPSGPFPPTMPKTATHPPNSRIPRTQPPPGGTVHSIPFHSFSRPAYMQLSHNNPLLDLPIIACEKNHPLRCVRRWYVSKKKEEKTEPEKEKIKKL